MGKEGKGREAMEWGGEGKTVKGMRGVNGRGNGDERGREGRRERGKEEEGRREGEGILPNHEVLDPPLIHSLIHSFNQQRANTSTCL